MDWRLLPESQVIVEGLDTISESFPFFSDFLEVFKEVEERILSKYNRTKEVTEKDEKKASGSDSEGQADIETKDNASGRQCEQDNQVRRKASNSSENWKADENVNDNQAAAKPESDLVSGQSPEPTAKECSSNASRSRNENGHRRHSEINDNTASQECKGNSVLSTERNSSSSSKAELDGDDVILSTGRSEHAVFDDYPDESGGLDESDGTENSLCGLITRGHDLYGDDDEVEATPGYEREMERHEKDNDKDKEDEDITDSDDDDDDESSESEKLHQSYLFNYRTMVLSVTEIHLGRASRWNAKVLRHHPTNFIALWNKVRLYMMMIPNLGHTFVSPALDTLECLKEVSNDRKEMLIAKAEVAAIYERIATSVTDLLDRSVPLFEEVLRGIDDLPEGNSTDSTFRDLAAHWKCDLASVYLEIMKTTESVLAKHGHTLSTVFSRIKDILQSVVSDETVTKSIRAQTSIELGDAFISYLGSAKKEERNQQFYADIDVDQCFRTAKLLNPNDPDVLLRAARQQRLSAKTEEELKEVIEELKRCVDLFSSMERAQKSVALHHLGLAHRSLWLVAESHTNPPMRDYFRSSGLTDADGFSPPVGCRVIKPPAAPLEFALVPRPYKNPPKHILLRDSNPIARKKYPNLLEARNSFLEADRLTADGSGWLYLVEVARTFFSAKDTKIAKQYFEKAYNRRSIGLNGVYLYEQMGLFEESTLTDEWNAAAYDIHLEKIKSRYREAIRYDTRGTRRAITAFYRLLAILYGQIHAKEDDLILQTEYFLLYMTIQQTERPNDMVKTMTNDDIKIGLMWRLIEMFHKRNDPHDAAAAFAYLSIIAVARKLNAEVKDVHLTISEKQTLLLDSAERVALERTVQPRYIPQAYEWLCYLDDIEVENRSTYSLSFGILIDVKKSDELKTVGHILRKQLEVKSCELIRTSELQDVHSTECLERVLQTMEKCASIVVIAKKESPLSPETRRIVKAFCNGLTCNRRRICQAVFTDSDDSELISDIPTWHIDRESVAWEGIKESEVSQACRLLRTLFLR